MSIGETFSRLLLKKLVDDVFLTGGVEALDAVVDFLTRCGQQDDPRLTAALTQAMQRAWFALETALGEEHAWARQQPGLAPRAVQALRHCLDRVLVELAHGGPVGNQPTSARVAHALRRQCLDDLHSATAQGALAGCLDHEEWARSNEVFVRFATNQGRRETRRRTEAQLLRDLEQHGCVGLMRLLTAGSALPLLLIAARAFVCQELAQLLYRCLQDSPEQTPDHCTLVLDILHELSTPHFSIWRSPVPRTAPVHWSRLESGSRRAARSKVHPARASRPLRKPDPVYRPRPRSSAANARASWGLAAVLTIAIALLIVVPLWLLVETAQHYERDHQRAVAEQQRLREERRRVEEERQHWIDAQRQIVRDEAAQQQALQRQRAEEEHRRQLEAEEEKQRAAERAFERRAAEKRRQIEEREARRREERERLERARVALEDGLTHAARRQDREALAALTDTIVLDPTLAGAWNARGVVRRRLGDSEGALADFHEAVRRNPDDVRGWFQCGELHAERRDHRQAVEAFTIVLRHQPDNVEAYRQRGLCYAGLGELEEAVADQTKAIALAPSDPWAYSYRADVERRRNNLVRAFNDLTAAIDREHGTKRALAGVYRERGLLALQWRNYEQAIRDLTQALQRDPLDVAALRARGLAYLRRGDWNEALFDAQELIRTSPHDSAAYKLRGQAYLGLGNHARAEEDLTQALRGGGDADTFYLRARVRASLGDFKEAIFDCNDATTINPRLAGAFYLRGKLNLREGYRVSSLTDFRTAHELDPQFPSP